MLCRMLCCSLVAVVLSATSLPADDDASPAGDGLNAAVQEYLQFAANDEWDQAVALLERLAEQYPDHPAVQLMHEHAQLRSQAPSAATPLDAASWEALCELQRRAKGADPEGQRIQAALEQRIDVDFEDASLSEVMRHIATTQGINVVLDSNGLTEVGLTMKSPINLRVNDVRLSTVLDLMLEPLNLGYVAQDEVLKITSRERLAGPLVTRVYSVSDLVRGRRHLVEGGPNADAGDVEELQRLSLIVQETIDPDGWSRFGGNGYLQPHESTNSLVIRQTQEVHHQIADLVDSLRRELGVTVVHDLSVLDLLPDEVARLGIHADSDPIVKNPDEFVAWWEGARISRRTEEGVARMKHQLHSGQTGEVDSLRADIESPFLLNATIAIDRRSVVVKLANSDSYAAGDVMAAVQTARVPDNGAAVFVLSAEAGAGDDVGLRICIVRPRIVVAEEEEELLGIAP